MKSTLGVAWRGVVGVALLESKGEAMRIKEHDTLFLLITTYVPKPYFEFVYDAWRGFSASVQIYGIETDDDYPAFFISRQLPR